MEKEPQIGWQRTVQIIDGEGNVLRHFQPAGTTEEEQNDNINWVLGSPELANQSGLTVVEAAPVQNI